MAGQLLGVIIEVFATLGFSMISPNYMVLLLKQSMLP